MKKILTILFCFSCVFVHGQNVQVAPGSSPADTTLEYGFIRIPNTPNAVNTTGKKVLIADARGVLQWIIKDSIAGSGGSGVNTLAAIGSSPNANGATISGSTLNLEPADGSFGGVVTTGTQTIAGAKTFSSAFTSSTSTTSPILIGGTGTGSSISIRPTSGVGSTGADIIFQNGNNGGTEIARVTGSNGYTGFGTASPLMKFDITNGTQVTGANSGNPNALNVTGSNQSLTGGSATMFLNSNSAMGADVGASLAFTALRVSGDNTSDMIFAIAKGAKENASSGNYNGYFAIATQSHNLGALAERFRITSGGNVGIGTSSPTSLLHVVPVQTTGIGVAVASSTTTTGTILDIAGTSTALASGNEGLNIAISGANGTNAITATGARISVTNTNGTSCTNVGLEVTASGATTANYAIIVPSGGGNVGIGTATPSVTLDVVGDAQIFNAASGLSVIASTSKTTIGDFAGSGNGITLEVDDANQKTTISGGTVTFAGYGAGTATFDASGNISSVSDIRLKNVQGGYNVGLSALMKIRPIVYKWNDKSKMETEHSYIGFSAQNINAVLGDNATGVNKDGYLSIQDRAIMATMVVAIQEQQKMIEELQKEIKKLKRK